MSYVPENLNKNSNMYLLLSELEDIKTLLGATNSSINSSARSASTNTATADNMYLQYPESTAEMYLDAGATFEREAAINRKLKQMCVSVPAGVVLELKNNNQTFAWFCDQAGSFEFDAGISIENLMLKVMNNTSESVRWTCALSFR